VSFGLWFYFLQTGAAVLKENTREAGDGETRHLPAHS